MGEQLVGATFNGFVDYSGEDSTEQVMLFTKEDEKFSVFALVDDDGMPFFHVMKGHVTGIGG